ncbi:MAG TPA: FecR family protein [Terriglobales bacterium]|jgi:ferric-dicitrate binding protein FerR (iron transport regulator)|nr:FecR family protein [Terriglobales bacterium]
MTAIRQVCTAMMGLLVLAGATGQNPETVALPVGSATIAEFKGDIALHAASGEVVTAQSGTVLAPESTIETNKGSVLLDLQDGSQVLVKSNSHVVLKAPTQEKGYWLELLLGKINAKIQKRLGNTPSFRMGTPTAVITVRGTRFSVEVNKKQRTSVEVYEGLVEVSGFRLGAPGPPVMLSPGYSTGVEQNRNPESPHGMDNRGDDESRGNRPGMGVGGGQHGDDRERQGSQPSTPNQNPQRSDHEKDD